MKFEYIAEVKKGYKIASPLYDEEETEIRFTIEARNRATADRMIKALLMTENVIECSGICIED